MEIIASGLTAAVFALEAGRGFAATFCGDDVDGTRSATMMLATPSFALEQ